MGSDRVVVEGLAVRVPVFAQDRDRIRLGGGIRALLGGDPAQIAVHLHHRREALFGHAGLSRHAGEEAADERAQVDLVFDRKTDHAAADLHGEALGEVLDELDPVAARPVVEQARHDLPDPRLERAHARRHEMFAESAAQLGVVRGIHVVEKRENGLHLGQQMGRGPAPTVRDEVPLAGPPDIVEAREREGVPARHVMDRRLFPQSAVDGVVVAVDDFVGERIVFDRHARLVPFLMACSDVLSLLLRVQERRNAMVRRHRPSVDRGAQRFDPGRQGAWPWMPPFRRLVA